LKITSLNLERVEDSIADDHRPMQNAILIVTRFLELAFLVAVACGLSLAAIALR